MLDFSNFWTFFLLGVMGSISIEIFKIYELRGKLHYKKYKNLYKSTIFWMVTISFTIVSGLLTWVIFESKSDVDAWQVVFTGMGISSIIKKVLESFASNKKLDAGGEEAIKIDDLF